MLLLVYMLIGALLYCVGSLVWFAVAVALRKEEHIVYWPTVWLGILAAWLINTIRVRIFRKKSLF